MKNFFTAIALLFCMFPLYGQDTSIPAKFAAELDAKSALIESIKCDFRQTKHVGILADDIISKGIFYYKRAEGMCLDFTHPEGDLIVMSSGKFKITSAGRTNIVGMNSNPMLRQMNNMLTACMTGDISMLENGSEVSYEDTGKTYTVTLKPTNNRARNYISQIILTFDKSDMSLNSMRTHEASGDWSEYVFTKKVLNSDIPDSIFKIN